MGRDSIRYYVVRHGRGYWQPTKVMREAGFRLVRCGPDGPDARRLAVEWSARWDDYRRGDRTDTGERLIPGSLADAFARFRRTKAWEERSKSTKQEYALAWRRIGPVFGPMRPEDVTLELIDAFKTALQEVETPDTVWRCIKIWRALWGVAQAMGLTNGKPDPSAKITRGQAARRKQRWTNEEVVRLVKEAWRDGHHGLACIIAVAWDSQLSPGDVRALTPAHRTGPRVFSTTRGKTGTAVLGTISRPTERIIGAYLDRLGVVMTADAPLFRGPHGGPYKSKTDLSQAFRRLRDKVFPGDDRTLMDMRRSGAVEALVGEADPGHLGQKMGNTIADARDLQRTYQPVDLAAVMAADKARLKGRQRIRELSDFSRKTAPKASEK